MNLRNPLDAGDETSKFGDQPWLWNPGYTHYHKSETGVPVGTQKGLTSFKKCNKRKKQLAFVYCATCWLSVGCACDFPYITARTRDSCLSHTYARHLHNSFLLIAARQWHFIDFNAFLNVWIFVILNFIRLWLRVLHPFLHDLLTPCYWNKLETVRQKKIYRMIMEVNFS